MSSISENGRPIEVSYATRSPRGRSNVCMEKPDLSCLLETTQSDRLKPPMTWPSTTAPLASKTTAVVIRDRSARVDLSRLFLSCANVPLPNWAPPYHAGSLSQSSNRYVVRCLWLVPLLSIIRLSVIACLSSRSLHRMLHYRIGSPRSLPSVVARIWLVPTCATVHAGFVSLCIVYVFLPLLIAFLPPPSALHPSPASCPLSRTSPVLFRRTVVLVS